MAWSRLQTAAPPPRIPLRPAAFLDRDGVLIADHGYVHRPQDAHWLPGVFDALQQLSDAGFALVIVTNQSGLARGLFSDADYLALSRHLQQDLADHGLTLSGCYHCPHHPEGRVPAYAQACDCRKPAPGLLLRAAEQLDLNLPASLMVGDRPGDMQAGRAAGVGRCALVHGSGRLAPRPEEVGADLVGTSLLDCVEQLLARPSWPVEGLPLHRAHASQALPFGQAGNAR